MPLLNNQGLIPLNTLALKAKARRLYRVCSDAELLQVLDALQEKDFLLLGGGSNVVLQTEAFDVCVQQCSKGIRLLDEDQDSVTIEVAAGEGWHDLVSYCLQQGWHGLENLALIPGTVGAAPIQNIGAYGVEVGAFIECVSAIDRQRGEVHVFTQAQCQFAYRDSVFKHAFADRLVITALQLRLLKNPVIVSDYAGLQESMRDSTPQALFDAVIALRQRKLPDPVLLPNAGSFFKNPIISAEQAQDLAREYPGLVQYVQADGRVKLAAAWLLDKAGWKGYRNEKVGVHAQQALVLINHNEGMGNDILALARSIQQSVAATFGVNLQVEPRIY